MSELDRDGILRRWMIACTPFGKYQNGDDEGDMDRDRLLEIVRRYNKYKRNVPIYLVVGEGVSQGHVFDLDTAGPADGWAEQLKIDGATGNLLAFVKLHGEAARWVDQDYVRELSIGTIHGQNPDGSEQGEILQHLVLTNEAFDKNTSTSVAASRYKGGEGAVSYFTTALPKPKEASMADDDTRTDEEKEKEIDELKARLAALEDKDNEIRELKAQLAKLQGEEEDPDEKDKTELKLLLQEKTIKMAKMTSESATKIRSLEADVKKLRSNPTHTKMVEKFKDQALQLRAEKIRRLVKGGVMSGQFNLDHIGGEPEDTYDHPSDTAVLSWFAGSCFKDSISNLEHDLEMMPKKKFYQRVHSGNPGNGNVAVSFSDEDRAFIRSHGSTPEAVEAGLKARDFTEFKEQMAALKK